jgi:hypothetical protein
MKQEKENDKVVLDLNELDTVLTKHSDDIQMVEIYRNETSMLIENTPEKAKIYSL